MGTDISLTKCSQVAGLIHTTGRSSISLCSCAYTCTVCVLICSGNKGLCAQDNSHFISLLCAQDDSHFIPRLCAQDDSHFIFHFFVHKRIPLHSTSLWGKLILNISVGPFPVVEATINKGTVSFFQAHALLLILAVHTASLLLSCTNSQPWDWYF